MNDTKLAKIATYRALCEDGHYNQAVVGFETLLEAEGTNLSISIELAETRMLQGYYNKCFDAIQLGLESHREKHGSLYWAAQILKCCVVCLVSGRFREHLAEARVAYNAYLSDSSSAVANRVNALTELYYCKSLFLAGNITQLHDFKDGALKILPRFSLFFDDLLRDGDFSSCLKLARCYSKSIDSPARAKLLDILEVHASTPTLIRTKAWIALAELCTDSSESSRQMELYKHAKESLLTSHAHIEIDLDLSMYYHACHNPSEENAQPDTDVGKLIYKYEEMDYPAGTLGALEKLLDLAMRVHNFDLSLGLSEEFDRIARETGSLLLWAMIKLRTLGYWHIRTGHDALVLTSAKELCGELLKFECPYHLGNTAQIITDVNLRLKETDEAIKWSLLCAETWNTCSPSAKSMAAFYVLQAKILAVEKSKEVVQPLIDWVDKMVEDDIAQNLVDNAIMKLDTIVTLLFQTHLIPENVKAEKIKELLGRIETYSKGLPQGQIEVKLANLYQHQAILHLANAKGKPDINTEDQALELQERAIQLYHKQRDPKLMLPLAVTRLQTGLTWHAIFKKIAKLDRKAGHVALDNALRMFGLSKQGFEAISSIELISQALYWVALNQYERWCEGLCHGELVLRSLSDAERGMNNHREELSMLGGVSAVASKQKISSSKHFRDVYRFAFQICVVEQRFQQAWIWVQKAKARSLSDLLGLGIGVPRTLLERIETQEDAHLLYKKENELAAILAATDPAARFHVRTQLEKLHLEMQDVQVLAELLNIRNGVPMALEQLQDIFSDNESGLTSKNVVFVDWFIQSDEIYLVVLKPPGTEPAVRRLNITLSFVKMWVEEFLKTPRGREESIEKDESEFDRPLAELDPLVEFLAELTEGGDVLIFSPTGILNSVPLHALRLPQSPQAIIERNPTIYCSSLTTFVQCCRRAATAVRPTQQKKTIISIYEESPEERLDENERAEIYETTGKLAETLNADHLSGIAVTPEIVKEHLPSSHLVHFHGHCDTSENNILDQSLRLSDGKGGIEHLTVRDLFALSLSTPHVSLLACGSATQQINLGDEPLGLVTALLCAGATSVLGTIWPVASSSARAFTDVFYKWMKKASNGSVLDLAFAVQQAVISMKRRRTTRQPYHWAAFVLHGAWSNKEAYT